MKTKILLNVICGGVLIFSFQNCAKTGFSSNQSDLALQSLSGDGDASGTLTQNGTVCTVEHDATADDSTHKSASCAHMKNECDTDASTDLVACIIVGNGKSQKLAVVNGAFATVTSASDSACISKAECLGDVAKAFNVEGAYDRGYCEHNPNVTRLTDAQVKTLLGI